MIPRISFVLSYRKKLGAAGLVVALLTLGIIISDRFLLSSDSMFFRWIPKEVVICRSLDSIEYLRHRIIER